MSLAALNGASAPSAASIAAQARGFETMAISQLLTPIFDTVDTPDARFGGSPAEKTWAPFLMHAIAAQMEADGGLGLAGQIAATLQEKPVL
jgi:Rod binding domain-containing protein